MPLHEMIADRYRVLSVLGKGGMGEVSRCRDEILGRVVAVKQLRPDLPHADEVNQLFYKEAAALASVTHPNLVRAYDFGALADGSHYLVMDYVPGFGLDAVWRHNQLLAWDLLAAVLDQLLDGLAHLHARGIVHRDLKPANVMLSGSANGLRVTIVDLGLASFRDDALVDLTKVDAAVLEEVARYATPPYCAPEQLLCHPIFQGPNTDLHAVGVLLFQFSTGRLPYSGADDAALLQALLRSQPAPFLPLNGAPAQVEAIVERLLAKRPWQRYAFAVDVRRALTGLWDKHAAQQTWDALVERISVAGETGNEFTEQPSAKIFAPPTLLSFRVPSLVGREGEQRALWNAAQRVAARAQALVGIEGDAGLGKSRLGSWLMQRVHEEGLMVALRISFGRGGGALQGVLGGLERFFGFGSAPRTTIERALIARWGSTEENHTIARGLAALLRPEQVEGEALQPIGADQRDGRLAALLGALRLIGAGRPLLLWVDNFPLADPQTLQLLQSLLALEQPLLLLLSGRAEWLSGQEGGGLRTSADRVGSGPVARFCGVHQGQVLQLAPLSRRPLKELLDALLAFDAEQAALDDAVVDAVYRCSGGNPLFALEQIQAWRQASKIWWLHGERRYQVEPDALDLVANSAASLWQSQFAALGPDAQLGALAATTLGSTFDRQLLEGLLTRLGTDPKAVVLTLLRERLLLYDNDHLTWYHDTLEEYLTSQLATVQQAKQLRLEAVALVTEHPGAHGRAMVLIAARNLIAAGRAEEACTRVFAQLEREWSRRRSLSDASEALALIAPILAEGYTAHYWLWRGRDELVRCDYTQALRSSELAASIANEGRDDLLLARARLHLGEAHKGQGNYGAAAAALSEALEGFTNLSDAAHGAYTALLLGENAMYLSQYGEAERYLRRGLAGVKALGLSHWEAWGFWCLASMLQEQGRYCEAKRWVEQVLDRYEAAGLRLGTGQAHWLLATICGHQGRLEEAVTHHREASAAFEESGDQWWTIVAAIQGGWIACVSGDYAAAAGVAQQLGALLADFGSAAERVLVALLGAAAELGRGEVGAARSLLEQARSAEAPEPTARQGLALLGCWTTLAEGDPVGAAHALERAIGVWRAYGLTAWGMPWVLGRLEAFRWPESLARSLAEWRAALRDEGAGAAPA